MKKNILDLIIKLSTQLFKYLSKVNCACCNSKCSANEKNELTIEAAPEPTLLISSV